MLLVFVSDSFEEIAFFGSFCDLGCDQIAADKAKVFKHKISNREWKKMEEEVTKEWNIINFIKELFQRETNKETSLESKGMRVSRKVRCEKHQTTGGKFPAVYQLGSACKVKELQPMNAKERHKSSINIKIKNNK